MRVLLATAVIAAIASPSFAQDQPARTRECFNPAETRALILEHHLSDPFVALRTAGGRMGAEPAGMRLCRWSDRMVYEITLLRRDGRVIRVFVGAADGQVIGTNNDR